MVCLAIAIVVVYEAFVMSVVSYFLGFSTRAAGTIGTSLCGRGVESVLYASVGSRVKGATMAAELNAFAGAFCFIMSAITPQLVKHSARIATGFARAMPKPLRFSAALISRTLGKVIIPSELRIFEGPRISAYLLSLFVATSIAVLVTDSAAHAILSLAGLAIAVALYFVMRSEISEVVKHVNYSNLGVVRLDKWPIVNLTSGLIFGAAISVLLVSATWTILWQISIVIAAGYSAVVAALMVWTYRTLYSEKHDGPYKVDVLPRVSDGQAEPTGVPKPVFGSVKASPKDVHL
jgi:hypothetical protein